MLAIKLPIWLVDIWSAYSDVIVPALMALVVAMITWLAIKIKADAKFNRAKAELQIEELKKINAKEDTRPELDTLKNELEDLKQTIRYLAEMINEAFQNSTLDESVKDSLTILRNKMIFGVDDDVVKQLTEEKTRLEEQVAGLQQQLKVASTVTPTKETRTRR